MAEQVIRIFSDLHFGDRSSRIARPQALEPLAEGASAWIINGDTVDTRRGPSAAYTTEIRAQMDDFLRALGFPVTQLTGNHDPDISGLHRLELAEGRVFLTHGDILYPEIVPWGLDAEQIRDLIEAEFLARGPQAPPPSLDEELVIFRRVAARIPQRHQSERRRGLYLLRLARDLMSPPWRCLRIFEAWRSLPRRAWELVDRHRLNAQIVLAGHSHWSGIWSRPGGPAVVNTGAFCRPFHPWAADLGPDAVVVRRVEERRGQFYPGPTVAVLRLTASGR